MRLLDFLEAVVPPGHLVAAKKVDRTRPDGKPFSIFSHSVATTHKDFAQALVNFALEKKDTYFALAAYKQGFHKTIKAGKEKTVVRVHDNVAALKALWLDIDLKDGYPDKRAAILALRTFCGTVNMPPPTILVDSGNGLHAYWTLSRPIELARWQKLADALKEAAKTAVMKADLACTGDPCRVLRPPGTVNWKDPANPKRVKVLFSSGKYYEADDLEARLTPYVAARVPVVGNAYNEFTGGVGERRELEPAFFEIVQKHCGVSHHAVKTHGEKSSEPEWVAMLQLLKFCKDADLWVHAVSDGHPGYDAAATNEKWQQRLENTAGPTLCSTFEQYHPEICKKCPRHGFIKSPIQVGTEETKTVGEVPWGWRSEKGRTERLMIDKETDQKMWVKVISYEFQNFRTTRSIMTGHTEHRIDVPGVIMDLPIPGEFLGNQHKLVEHMALFGVTFKDNEAGAFKTLMSTWLKTLQEAKHVAEVTEQLGWMEKEGRVIGFSCGPTTFYSDGRVRNDVRVAKEFAAIAKHYAPKGDIAKWKEVSAFLAKQNNPAFTALVSSAFAAPILRFTGVTGAILAFVSAESGVGKTSALKCAQAVWGSPTHGVNAIDDTPKSVARKLGFLNNLPAYWDELRGQSTVEEFLTLAFQVSQGKEKTRLDSSAQMREIHTWETMLVVASNDSVFEAMGQYSIGSDAGVARTFEIIVEPFHTDVSRAEVAILFEHLNTNFGHAGRIYAEYLATHTDSVRERVQSMRKKLGEGQKERSAERFWFSIMATLIVGAQIAGELELMAVDIKTLAGFLIQNLTRLRGRSIESMSSSDPAEVLAAYMQEFQDRTLLVDAFPPFANPRSYMPQIFSAPRADKIVCHIARDAGRVRFARGHFREWLGRRGMRSSVITRRIKTELNGAEMRGLLGIGTKYEIPTRQYLLECDVTPSATAEDIVGEHS
jgi:hypothetical protein